MVFADMPHANQFMIGVMAMVAQHERELISQRTKAALAAAKARGKRLGGYRGGRSHQLPVLPRPARRRPMRSPPGSVP